MRDFLSQDDINNLKNFLTHQEIKLFHAVIQSFMVISGLLTILFITKFRKKQANKV